MAVDLKAFDENMELTPELKTKVGLEVMLDTLHNEAGKRIKEAIFRTNPLYEYLKMDIGQRMAKKWKDDGVA